MPTAILGNIVIKMVKRCSGECQEEKDLELFDRQHTSPDGRRSMCKVCCKKRYGAIYRKNATEYYYRNKSEVLKKVKLRRDIPANKVKAKQYGAQYYIENKEAINKHNKEYAELNKEHLAKKSKEYSLKNRETLVEYQKEYRKNNSEKIKLQKKIYQEENADFIKAQAKKWKQNNKATVLAATRKRELAKIDRTPAWADYEKVKDVYKDCEEVNLAARTAGCTEKFVVDHVIPLQGELVSGLHIESNLQIITQTDNLVKGNSFNYEDYKNSGE